MQETQKCLQGIFLMTRITVNTIKNICSLLTLLSPSYVEDIPLSLLASTLSSVPLTESGSVTTSGNIGQKQDRIYAFWCFWYSKERKCDLFCLFFKQYKSNLNTGIRSRCDLTSHHWRQMRMWYLLIEDYYRRWKMNWYK